MSFVDMLQPIYSSLPEVKAPETAPTLKKKLIWTAAVLLVFFVMGNITLIGLAEERGQYLAGLQTLLASNMGSLISAGIGPIVLASIILQLMVGGKLINIDLSNPAERAKFQGLQKLFAVVLCFFEAVVYTVSGMLLPIPGFFWIIVAQVTLGSLILLYLDEVVSRYGIGSGISLFIAAGVSAAFFWQLFRPPILSELSPVLAQGGVIFQFIASFSAGANFLLFMPVLVSIVIFLIIVFAEGMHVNIPITMGYRGAGGRFPVKLLYVSNLPVILAVALFANIKIWTLTTKSIPVIGWLLSGLEWATNSPFDLFYKIIIMVGAEGPAVLFAQPLAGEILQAIVYLVVLVACCIVFGVFWVQMAGQGPEAVAEQLERSGMYIPGFRRDKRIIQKILERYIPTITILGSIFVGLLAGLGNMALGTLASGTGILLTVGIVYRFYEELAKEQMMTMHPLLGKLFKG